MTDLHIAIHISRSAGYYFWKALLPLYLLTILSFTTFEFEVDDLSSRNDTVSTYFLAAFAMLYVVGESLPRTDFLTKIDIVIVLTTTLLVIIGITSVVLHRVAKKDDAALAMAEKWNTRIEVGLLALYATINIIIFVPSWWTHRKHKNLLNKNEPAAITPATTPALSSGSEETAFTNTNTNTNNCGVYQDKTCHPSTIERPTVRKGAEYYLWSELVIAEEAYWSEDK